MSADAESDGSISDQIRWYILPTFATIAAIVVVIGLASRRKFFPVTVAAADDGNVTMRCASCGIAAADDIHLKKCASCHLVRYCSVTCQRNHRPQHKRECKKRAAELRDELLFKQPESTYLGDCPICCLPLSIDTQKSGLMTCCCKLICNGCDYANKMREKREGLQQKCPFCRHSMPKLHDLQDVYHRTILKRLEANNPVAVCEMGLIRANEGDYKSAVDYWTKAAALGDIRAHYNLSQMYNRGVGVEKNERKELHHLEEAAIGGNPEARHDLGIFEGKNGMPQRSIKHFVIAANMGHDKSLSALKDFFKEGFVTKDDFEAALRGHKAAVDATKSPQRNEAEAAWKKIDRKKAAALQK